MLGKLSGKVLFVIFAVVFSAVSMGSSYCPTPVSDKIIAQKESDMKKYHFKDSSYTCTTCHSDVPQNGFETVGVESNTCYACHNRVDNDEWVHGPVGVGECSVCHDPHGSKNAKFLVRQGEKLCTYCHDENRARNHAATVNSNNCISCHNPHGGSTTTMLRR